MKKRSLTTKNLLDKRPQKPIRMSDESLLNVIGADAEMLGLWLVYGFEKNGKTWFSLMLAKALSEHYKVAYISAEEGLEGSFISAIRRANLTTADRICWEPWMSKAQLLEHFSKPRTADVIFIDNLTAYRNEIRSNDILNIQRQLPGKLIVYIAHEERKQPTPTSAKTALTFAKVVFRVVGLRVLITSRYEGGGGEITLDQERSALYWGEKINE